jgi:hypothetical protein
MIINVSEIWGAFDHLSFKVGCDFACWNSDFIVKGLAIIPSHLPIGAISNK